MTPPWATIREDLLARVDEDQRVRAELARDGSLFQGYHPRMQAVHDANAARLAEILDTYGWPGIAEIGQEGAEAAWLIAHHAIAHPELQRRALRLLKAAVGQGNAPATQAALLEDRIRCLEGRPQLFGTQFDWDANGEMSPLPVEDPETVDVRRREIGLGPLEQHAREQRAAIARDGEGPPRDWAARQREMDAWCRKVGWRK